MSESKKIYFISDVHLGFFEREKDAIREKLLLDFLESIKSDASELVIVGDLFDYWFEYKKVVPRDFYLTLAKLKELKEYGVNIEYIMGNHDFGHKDFFEKEIGIPIIKNDIERNYFGKKFYISHGDGKAYNDKMYLLLRRVLRNRLSQWLFSKLHPDCGIGLASHSSKKSREYTAARSYGEKEGMLDFAKTKTEEGVDYVVMGHRHIATIIDFGKGKYVNLGEWLSKPAYGVFDGDTFELIYLKSNW